MLKSFFKKLARALFGPYEIYYIYTLSCEDTDLSASGWKSDTTVKPIDITPVEPLPTGLILENAGYFGAGSQAYVYENCETILGVCFYWWGNRYKTRGFWPLSEHEAKLVHIVTDSKARGRGVATKLISQSSTHMFHVGYIRLFARIWHSNLPSLKAFEKAGWTKVATVIQLYPFRRKTPLRLTWRG